MATQLLITKKEAAELLAISVRHLERLIADGVIKVIRLGRTVRLRLSDIQKLVESGC